MVVGFRIKLKIPLLCRLSKYFPELYIDEGEMLYEINIAIN